jgi:hypothetical protein
MRAGVLALALVSLAGLAGCSTSSGGTSPDAGPHLGSPCQVDDDCLPGPFLCGWPIDGGCDAKGTCNAEVLGPCNDGPVVCACDGTSVVLACIYGPGHSPAPIVSSSPGCAFEGGQPD